MKLDLAAILSAFGIGGLIGSIVTLLVKDRLSRLADQITEQDIADCTLTWERWLLLARNSLGPLPESDRPLMRKRTAGMGEVEEAA